MHSSPRSKEATQVWLQGCCLTPTPEAPDPKQPVSKTTNTSSACRRNFTASTTSSLFPNTSFTDHESILSLEESFVQFIKAYPKYSDTAPVDRIRAREYSQLSLSNHVCLDYIGIGLFSHSQVKSQYTSLVSTSSSSSPPPSDFTLFGVTFKPASLKTELLNGGEGSGPFQTSRKLITVYDHESEALDSMVGISEKRGARLMPAEFKWPRLRIHSAKLRKMIVRKNNKNKNKNKSRGLFVFPLHSRMSGGSYSYQWMTVAQEHGWHVLLDACALGPKDMDSFGLSLFRPDFLVCSFYKVFGENPTGFGCLFVKRSVVSILEESACGGIVSITPARKEVEQLAKLGINQEDADTSCSNIVGDKEISSNDIDCRCLDHVDSLGLMLVSSRGRYLINWLVSALMKLHHPNRLENFHLVEIYGPKVRFDRGPALAFNIYDWKGEKVEAVLVQKLADRNNISLGHGVLNHIWFPDSERNAKENETASGKPRKAEYMGTKVVTVALTFLANFEDVYRLWGFVARFLDADFVEKERWRYTALNQKTIEV